MQGQLRLVLAWLTLAAVASPAWAAVHIDLYCSGNRSNCSLNSYDDEDYYTSRYANIPGNKMSGHVMEPFPNNACLYITPLPDNLKVNGTKWFALVSEYPACPEQMIDNVRNAGFDLIIAYRHNRSSARDLCTSVQNKLFPIVSISGKYGQYLSDNALSDSPYDAITALIKIEVIDLAASVLISITIFFFGVVPLCVICCILCCFVRRRINSRVYVTEFTPLRDQNRRPPTRNNRQELIESIQQQFLGGFRRHIPLGAADTQALPLQPAVQMKRESRCEEACAICVEDFEEGDTARILPCNHYFHPKCIDPWLTNHSSLCPLCKRRVPRSHESRRVGGALVHPPPPPVARDVRLNVELEMSTDDSLSSSDEESNSTQSAVDHLAAETPANQHAGAGASDSVSLLRLPLLDHDVDLSLGERTTRSI